MLIRDNHQELKNKKKDNSKVLRGNKYLKDNGKSRNESKENKEQKILVE